MAKSFIGCLKKKIINPKQLGQNNSNYVKRAPYMRTNTKLQTDGTSRQCVQQTENMNVSITPPGAEVQALSLGMCREAN